MQRTIKFRGKRVDNGEWVYGDLIHGQGDKHGKLFILPQQRFYPSGCNNLDGWDVIPETVGQFIGLTDKNGKEIYDGDIVKDRVGRIMKVGYYNYKDCFIAITETNFYHADFYDWSLKAHFPFNNDDDIFSLTVEIIGNLHDNPELLKQLK